MKQSKPFIILLVLTFLAAGIEAGIAFAAGGGNSAPSITGASISPDIRYDTSTLTAVASGWFDADGDPEGYTYQWYKNGSNWGMPTSQVCDHYYLSIGDEVYCVVTPFDGTDYGTPKTTATATIIKDKNQDHSKVNIDKIITTIDGIKNALDGPAVITAYDDYEDTSAKADSIELDLSKMFSSTTAPGRNNRPEFYYHAISETDMPVLDTNDADGSSAFIDTYKSILRGIKEYEDADWTYINSLEDAMRAELLPDLYKFTVPQKAIAMSGYLSDFGAVKPVIFDREDDSQREELDLREVYMAKDATYLYIAMKFRGNPYTNAFQAGEYLNYHMGFNCISPERGPNGVPVTIELRGYPGNWRWWLWSYGIDKGEITTSGFAYAAGDIIEFRIPLSYLVGRINEYESSGHFPTGVWDGKEVYVSFSLWSKIGSEYYGDSADDGKLAKIN